ncbi:MAG: FGGY family carbohydrate kinase [Bryobacteraceae bacterium]
MTRDILAVDVGTTALKLAVFGPDLDKRCEASRRYDVRLSGDGGAEIDPETWWQALKDCCAEVRRDLGRVGTLTWSVTTPGLTAMDEHGRALSPAMLFFDGRSHEQARAIRAAVGEDRFLRETCNLPVSGGSSLCSILWLREHRPETFQQAAKFGHTNTYMVKRAAGAWAIDPSTVSITGLYNTARNDLTWNRAALEGAGISSERLPPLLHSHQSAGRIAPQAADELGLPLDCDVLCGGNDAVLGALSCGVTESGDIGTVCGTCEITYVAVDRPIASPSFNLRCHVLPGRWMTFFVLNTGGKALEWFQQTFCREMDERFFYERYVPGALAGFFDDPRRDARESALPEYIPYLGGSRYSLERMKAGFNGLTLGTTRDDLLLSVIRGNALYHRQHLEEVGKLVALGKRIVTTGGGASIPGYLAAKRRWTGDFEYKFRDQSSELGAAVLARLRHGLPPLPEALAARSQ